MMKKLMQKKASKKGFTLAELLIVVAIIAVLVAIAIPTFSSATTKAKEAADLANVRGWYAEVVVNYLTEEDTTLPTEYPTDGTTWPKLNYPDNCEVTKAEGTTDWAVSYEGDKIGKWSVEIDGSAPGTTTG